jgi:aminopeptidase N
MDPEPGIPLALAEARARALRDLRYELSFAIPERAADPIDATARIRFTLADAARPLVLDFAPGADAIRTVAVGGRPSRFRASNGHIVIPREEVTTGENLVEIAFRAGDAALNRNPDFLYSLFVPARAHVTFPCFDQPDLKARFTLHLAVPAGWEAVSNGAETAREAAERGQTRITYAETLPISTYLFAFAAGKFQVERAERNGRTFRMLHRETDARKVERNRAAIFDLHASALAWLEDYAASDYPFGKFDFVAIPSFQFGGMEHPGSIFYNAASLLLDESATESQVLGRASVIAHETAHMWFGDLVTMRWFDDVWMKEVFANFLAAKIVNPSFPRVNHELRFLVAHYPQAYGIDRTAGSHPIRQQLANLSEAGSLYGAIIYQKAPIVMRQLERQIGELPFRDGLRAYLDRFKFGNASWTDLVRLLDERAALDVAAWSRAWVEEAGRPSVRTDVDVDASGTIRRLALVQSDPQSGRSLRWPQQIQVAFGAGFIPVTLDRERVDIAEAIGRQWPGFILPAGGGLAYGDFTLDERSRAALVGRLPEIDDAVTRGAAWVTLWDEMLGGRLRPPEFFDAALRALQREDIEQNVQLLAGYLGETFWRFLSEEARAARAPRLEAALRSGVGRARTSSLKSTLFAAYYGTATTAPAVAFLERVWRRQERIPGLILAEPDEATLALELAVRGVPSASAILEEQRGRFLNPDRKARFEFVMPALSARQDVRDLFFASLADSDNRRREPWVLEGVRYLNHPLRAAAAQRYLRPALELVEEIRRTGDIFFPRNWMDALLSGHGSREAAGTVAEFLASRSDYPVRLRRIIEQSAHNVRRAAEIASASPLPPPSSSTD